MAMVNKTNLKSWCCVAMAASISLWLTGCQPTPPGSATGSGSNATTDGDGHEHGDHAGHDHEGHSHAHHGPHGGDVMAIGDEEYHAEWTHDDEGKVTFYILDADVKNEVPIAAEKITIEVKIGDKAPMTYELLAVNPSGDEMKTAQFEIVDKELVGVIEVLKPNDAGVTATLNVEIGGKPYQQKIAKEEHDHAHEHAHEGEHKAEAKSADEKPASEEKPAEAKPAEEKPATDEKPAEEKPAEAKPAEEEPTAAKPK